MLNEPNSRLDRYRKKHPLWGKTPKGVNYGYFEVGDLRIISSGTDDDGWEHVSVSLPDRCPTWDEMCKVKTLFWKQTETVVQLHPRKSEYVNDMPFCLHLWRKADAEHPLPPTVKV